MASETPLYRVHLIDEATVVERGEQVRVWFCAEHDAWVHAHRKSGAEVELAASDSTCEACPPGTVWRRQIELLLPKGTRLLCRTTAPHLERRAPLDYLRRGKLGSGRVTFETQFLVVGNYRLETVPERGGTRSR